jgi:hypothetical protein
MVFEGGLPFGNGNARFNREDTHGIGTDDEDETRLSDFWSSAGIEVDEPDFATPRINHRSPSSVGLYPIHAIRLNSHSKFALFRLELPGCADVRSLGAQETHGERGQRGAELLDLIL